MAEVTLQLLTGGRWADAALLEMPTPEQGAAGPCNFEYLLDYYLERIGSNTPLEQASVRFPLIFGPTCLRRWPAFLDDIRPLGGAGAWWLRRLGLKGTTADDFRLLREGTIAPIGNLRIKESVPAKTAAPPRFPSQAVVDREHGFLEFAADQGAQVGGATGAGGDAPKLVIRLDERDRVWIDPWQDDPACPDRHYLVKFARGARTARDRDILRSEYVYYRALAALGVDTISVDGMFLEEGEGGPSLWLPRFDVQRRDGLEVRLGVESMYSLLDAEPAAYLTHQRVLAALRAALGDAAWPATLLDYLKRDLLNLVFGNSDNHGRNTALLKTEAGMRLAPIYDFAPMKMDPEGVTRTTKWDQFELGGVVDWPALLASFGPDEEFLRAGLRDLALRLRTLPQLLRELGLPAETLTFPALDLQRTEARLRAWGLL